MKLSIIQFVSIYKCKRLFNKKEGGRSKSNTYQAKKRKHLKQ
jgi:hypothetical protein